MIGARQIDIARCMEADFYCRCDAGHAWGEVCQRCGCDYEDSVTSNERAEEERREYERKTA